VMPSDAPPEQSDRPHGVESAASEKGPPAAPKPVAAKRRSSRRRDAGRLLDLKEAEAYSGLSAWTLRGLITTGDLPVVRVPRLVDPLLAGRYCNSMTTPRCCGPNETRKSPVESSSLDERCR
jgi:hypothetical protein